VELVAEHGLVHVLVAFPVAGDDVVALALQAPGGMAPNESACITREERSGGALRAGGRAGERPSRVERADRHR
jgi:hypothetical protein